MELDFNTVKALSSPTRIRILNQILDGETTPTALSQELGRSKSTISSHLDTLKSAGLVEKDQEEGRRRVIYQPTSKARDIVSGKERRVKFSLTSSLVSGLAGISLLGSRLLGFSKDTGYGSIGGQVSSLSMESASKAPEAGAKAAETGTSLDMSTAVLVIGLGFISISVLSLVYGVLMRRLGS